MLMPERPIPDPENEKKCLLGMGFFCSLAPYVGFIALLAFFVVPQAHAADEPWGYQWVQHSPTFPPALSSDANDPASTTNGGGGGNSAGSSSSAPFKDSFVQQLNPEERQQLRRDLNRAYKEIYRQHEERSGWASGGLHWGMGRIPRSCQENGEDCLQKPRIPPPCEGSDQPCRNKPPMVFGPLFKGADKDKNGLISRQEAAQSLPWVSRHFNELDVTKDGQVSIEEIRLWRKNRQNVFIERSP